MWRKPCIRDDWGNITIHAGPVKYTKCGTNDSLDIQPPIIYPGLYKIKWPDGTERSVKIKNRKQYESVSDHGHNYDVYNCIPVISFIHNGARIKVDLHESGCKVWVDKKNIEKGYMGKKPV